jgi:hypothetical protein
MNIFSIKKENKGHRSGFAILYAVLTAAVLAAASVSMYNIALRENILSTLAEESVAAFYAADSVTECVGYWDAVHNAFGDAVSHNIRCEALLVAGNNVPGSADQIIPSWANEPLPTTNTLKFRSGLSASPCTVTEYDAVVDITKGHVGNVGTGKIYSQIHAYGYNTCLSGSSRRLERGIDLSF